MRELNAPLERRIAERTTELTASEARLRTLMDDAPETLGVMFASRAAARPRTGLDRGGRAVHFLPPFP